MDKAHVTPRKRTDVTQHPMAGSILRSDVLFCNGARSEGENMQPGHIRRNQHTYSINTCVTFTALSCDSACQVTGQVLALW